MLNQFQLQKAEAEVDRLTKEFATNKNMFHSSCHEFGIDARHLVAPVAEQLAVELLKNSYSNKWHDRMSRLTSEDHNVLRDCVLWVLNSNEIMKKWGFKQEQIDNLKRSIEHFAANQDAYISRLMNNIGKTPFSTT